MVGLATHKNVKMFPIFSAKIHFLVYINKLPFDKPFQKHINFPLGWCYIDTISFCITGLTKIAEIKIKYYMYVELPTREMLLYVVNDQDYPH
jgi:hypothetical protein